MEIFCQSFGKISRNGVDGFSKIWQQCCIHSTSKHWNLDFDLLDSLLVVALKAITSQLVHNKSSAVAEMGDLLATIDMGRKLGRVAVPVFGRGELGSHLTQCGWVEAYLRTKWHLNPSSCLATIHQRSIQTGQTDNGTIA